MAPYKEDALLHPLQLVQPPLPAKPPVKINYLAYAPEIAAVMLRRQQASAIISAREKIVEGAVSMVHMALDKLSQEEIVELDEEKKAAMVSNLLVVLCADESAQPVLNTGTLNH